MGEYASSSRGREVVRRYFVAILAVSLLLLIPSIFLTYNSVERLLIEELHDSSLDRLEAVSSTVTTLHFSTIPATVALFEQKEVQRLMYGLENEGSDLLRRIELLQHAQLSNPIIDSVVVYNYRTQMFYPSAGGPQPAALFTDRKLIEVLNNIRRYGTYRYIPRQLGDRNVFTLIVGHLPTVGETMRGAMIVNIDERAFRALFASDQGGAETIVLSHDGTILSHPDMSRFGQTVRQAPIVEGVTRSEDAEGSFVTELGGKESLVTFATHPVMQWRFVQTVPADLVFAEIRDARNRTLLLVAAFLLFAVLATFVASRRLARPVQKLSARAEELHDYYESHRSLHRRDLLRALLLGEQGEDQVAWEAEDLAAIGADSHRIVLLVLLEREAVASVEEILEALRRHLSNSTHPVPLSPERGALVLPGSDLPPGKLGAKELLRRLIPQEAELPFPGAYIGVSSLTNKRSSLAAAYRDAVEAASARFRDDGRKLFFHEETTVVSGGYKLPEEAVERLLREVKGRHLRRAKEILHTLLDDVRSYRYDDFTFLAQYLLYEASRHIGSTAPDSVSSELGRLRASTDWLTDVSQLERRLLEVFETYAEAGDSGGSSRRNQTVQRVVAQIDGNYRDKNLSPASIADGLSLSTNYVRRMFKEEHGVSVSDYITQLRLEECKRRLLSEDVAVKELFGEVGFSSYNYFFETFKKNTGMTPLEYKRRYLGEENLSHSFHS